MIARAKAPGPRGLAREQNPLAGGRQMLTFRDDNHANVFGLPNDLQNQIIAQEMGPGAMFWTAQKDLRDLIAARKIEDSFRGVIAFQLSRFDVKIPGEVEVFFQRFLRASRRVALGPTRRYRNRKTIRAQVIRPSAPPPDEH